MSGETVTCTGCGAKIGALEVFPGGICIDCYRPTGEAIAATMTAEELADMWGADVLRERGTS